jgi:8-oxo-dGTP pyrophosphatase MutT (NUDIX family)
MDEIRAVPVSRLELRFTPQAWPFAEQRRAEIDAYFADVSRTMPDLWNGRVMLLHQWALENGAFKGAYLETDFASMLAWRDWDFPDETVHNCFAQGALRASDGAFLLGVMAPHTANAGKIYFPSGTPDPDDIDGGMIDLDGSVMRELAEETGLVASDVVPQSGWHAVFAGPRIGMMKVLQSAEPATTLRARILDYLAAEQQPELCDIRIVRSAADLDPMMPSFIPAFLHEIWK